MDSPSLRRADIESLRQAAETCTPAAGALLRSLVSAIYQVAGGQPSASFTVEAVEAVEGMEGVPTVPEAVAATFTAEPGPQAPASALAASVPPAGHHVNVRFRSITR